MKLAKRILVAVLAVAMVAACFAGCSKPESSEDTEKTDAKTLVMATNAEFPPYEYFENEQIVGIDAEIAKAICDKLGYKLEIEHIDFDSIIPGVQGGKYDFGMAGMTASEDRLKNVNFTQSYATGIQAIIVTENSDIKTADDLSKGGITIGVQKGTTGDIYCTDDIEKENLGTVERYNKGADAVMALTSGKVDCVVIDNEPAKVFVEKNKGLKLLDSTYAEEDYAIAVSKDNDALLKELDTALGELIADGTVKQIIDKYIPAA